MHSVDHTLSVLFGPESMRPGSSEMVGNPRAWLWCPDQQLGVSRNLGNFDILMCILFLCEL